MGKRIYHIRPIPLCRGLRDKSLWTYRRNSGQMVSHCVYVWYIDGSKPKILVDVGVRADLYQAHGATQNDDIQSLEEGLGKAGVTPEEIDIVILTHLHWDHVSLASKFTKAKFIVQEAELDFARNPHPAVAAAYDAKLFKDLDFEVIDGDEEIIEGVRVLLTPGHSPGAQSVLVETPGGLAIITGFCCIRDNFEPPSSIGLPVITPGVHINVLEAYDSLLKVKEMADIVVPLHEPEYAHVNSIP